MKAIVYFNPNHNSEVRNNVKIKVIEKMFLFIVENRLDMIIGTCNRVTVRKNSIWCFYAKF